MEKVILGHHSTARVYRILPVSATFDVDGQYGHLKTEIHLFHKGKIDHFFLKRVLDGRRKVY